MKKSRLLAGVVSLLMVSSFALLPGCGGDSTGSGTSFSSNSGSTTGGTTGGSSASSSESTGSILDRLTIGPSFGVVALSSGGIGILNGRTVSAVAPLLQGELGSIGGGRFDVVISPDGKTTLVSNFGDSTVYIIDTTYPANPVVVGSINVGFFAEDMDITPDGRYVLVTDGGFSSKIAVIDVPNRTLLGVSEYSSLRQFQSIAIAGDGVTVLAADYWGGKVHVLTINVNGQIKYSATLDISKDMKLRPVNVSISPDAHTALVACVGAEEYMAIPVLSIWEPGKVTVSRYLTPNTQVVAAQSIVFNRASTKAFVYAVQPMPEEKSKASKVVEYEPEEPNNVILVLDVTPGNASQSGPAIEVDFIGRSQLFGVDTLTVDNETGYLYVSNPTLSGGKEYVQVVDVNSRSVIKTINFEPVYVDLDEEISLPVGLYFWNPSRN